MRIILLFLYFVSMAVVIMAFYTVNYLSATLNPTSEIGMRNGSNTVLIVPVFAMPFFLYFTYGTIEFSMRLVRKIADRKTIGISMVTSLAAIGAIGFYTYRKALALHDFLAGKLEPDQVKSLGLWNMYSNSIFFNALTFLLLILTCFFIGGLWGISKTKKSDF
jgi:hypothetical protein